MGNIKMIVTDLDRTLLRYNKSLSEYTKSVFTRCHQKGTLIVFATARPERATKQLQMDKLLSYVIANNGATITSDGKCLQNILIPDDTKYSLIARFINDNDITSITVEADDFLYTNDKDHKNWSLDADWNTVLTDFHTPIKEKTPKISVECKNAQIVQRITCDYPEVHLLPNSGESWHQIVHNNSSKFNAITFISELTGIALEDSIAFGDDYNDVEMIQKCGVGVAVDNAIMEAKQVADFICEANDNDGVAKYLERYVLCT